MNIYLTLILLLLSNISLFSQKNTEQNRSEELKINRLDKELFEYIKLPSVLAEKQILSKNKELLEALAQTLNIQYTTDTEMLSALKKYFSHPSLFDIYKTTEGEFINMSKYEEELSAVLKRASSVMVISQPTYFYTHVSGFKENIIAINNIISLSLDKYLGENFKYYTGYFDAEERSQMIPKMIVRDYTIGWILSNYVKSGNMKNDNLLAHFIYQGKLYYILSELLPDYSINELMGCSLREIDWYKEHEKHLWKEIVKNNYLYSNDKGIINTWMLDKDIPYFTMSDSPGKVGYWIGYQLVKKYMSNTSGSIKELLEMDDSIILKKSKYTP